MSNISLSPIVFNVNDVVLEEGTREAFKSNHKVENTARHTERLQAKKEETHPVSQAKAKRIGTNVEALRVALREREAQEKLNNQ